jgi:hypothetical protein
MGGLVNLIKKLFSGIFSFIGGLLGGKKSNGGYYLELSDAEVGKSIPAKAESQSAVAAKPAKAESTAVSAKPASPEPAVVNVAVTNGSKPTAPATPTSSSQPAANSTNNYLTPLSMGSRRRPGANMNSFLEMARGMKSANN